MAQWKPTGEHGSPNPASIAEHCGSVAAPLLPHAVTAVTVTSKMQQPSRAMPVP